MKPSSSKTNDNKKKLESSQWERVSVKKVNKGVEEGIKNLDIANKDEKYTMPKYSPITTKTIKNEKKYDEGLTSPTTIGIERFFDEYFGGNIGTDLADRVTNLMCDIIEIRCISLEESLSLIRYLFLTTRNEIEKKIQGNSGDLSKESLEFYYEVSLPYNREENDEPSSGGIEWEPINPNLIDDLKNPKYYDRMSSYFSSTTKLLEFFTTNYYFSSYILNDAFKPYSNGRISESEMIKISDYLDLKEKKHKEVLRNIENPVDNIKKRPHISTADYIKEFLQDTFGIYIPTSESLIKDMKEKISRIKGFRKKINLAEEMTRFTESTEGMVAIWGISSMFYFMGRKYTKKVVEEEFKNDQQKKQRVLNCLDSFVFKGLIEYFRGGTFIIEESIPSLTRVLLDGDNEFFDLEVREKIFIHPQLLLNKQVSETEKLLKLIYLNNPKFSGHVGQGMMKYDFWIPHFYLYSYQKEGKEKIILDSLLPHTIHGKTFVACTVAKDINQKPKVFHDFLKQSEKEVPLKKTLILPLIQTLKERQVRKSLSIFK